MKPLILLAAVLGLCPRAMAQALPDEALLQAMSNGAGYVRAFVIATECRLRPQAWRDELQDTASRAVMAPAANVGREDFARGYLAATALSARSEAVEYGVAGCERFRRSDMLKNADDLVQMRRALESPSPGARPRRG